jgi:TIR domain
MAGIFLSYRRADATGWAGRLHDSLVQRLPGVKIFMDVEEIPPGVKFADYIP